MSNDLISRSALMSHIESQYREWGEDYDAEQILGDIEDAPTAYDVDKVVEQMEEEKKCYFTYGRSALYRAIEIIKAGGVSDI